MYWRLSNERHSLLIKNTNFRFDRHRVHFYFNLMCFGNEFSKMLGLLASQNRMVLESIVNRPNISLGIPFFFFSSILKISKTNVQTCLRTHTALCFLFSSVCFLPSFQRSLQYLLDENYVKTTRITKTKEK